MSLNNLNILQFLQNNSPFSLNYLPHNTYLVGGAVRDALLQRHQKHLDLDFVLPDKAINVARSIATDYKGGFVLLDKERQIARVVLPSATLDFAQQEGETLIEDLGRRDYTINAIACNCRTGEIIDPFQGKIDLENKIIRMVSEANLIDDPLRLLRAYRQASQLNFHIEKDTQITIRKLAPQLSTISPERVNSELGYLLASKNGNFWLNSAYEDGILSVWLENLDPEKLSYLDKIDNNVKLLGGKWNYFRELNLEVITLAKLSLLTSSSPDIAEIELTKLKYSRQEIRGVMTILKGLNILLNCQNNLSLREQYFFFLEVKQIFPALILLAHAYNINQDLLTTLINRYLDQNDLVAHPQPLLTGNDLMKELNINPSPLIGELLTEIAIAQIEGKINNIENALQWAKKNLEL